MHYCVDFFFVSSDDSNGADVLCALAGPMSFKLLRVGYAYDRFFLNYFSNEWST
jgi:hypothetical protein